MTSSEAVRTYEITVTRGYHRAKGLTSDRKNINLNTKFMTVPDISGYGRVTIGNATYIKQSTVRLEHASTTRALSIIGVLSSKQEVLVKYDLHLSGFLSRFVWIQITLFLFAHVFIVLLVIHVHFLYYI